MTTNAQGVFYGKKLELEPLAEYINNATGAEKQLKMVETEENLKNRKNKKWKRYRTYFWEVILKWISFNTF